MSDLQEYIILRNLLRGTATFTGEAFISAAVRSMAIELKADQVFITRTLGDSSEAVEVLAAWRGDKAVSGWNFELQGTPCDLIYRSRPEMPWTQMRVGKSVAIAKDVCRLFDATRHTSYESFIGVPLWNSKDEMIGHVALFFDRDLMNDHQRGVIVELCELFCQKVQSELNRMLLERAREQLLGELEQANRRLTQESVTDSLTGLYNRRYFNKRMQQAFARMSRSGEGFALMLIDLDYLKKLNDVHGHAVGDAALARIAEVLLQGTRNEVEMVFRIGGDEFAILCSGAIDSQGLLGFGRRLNALVANLRFTHEGTPLPLAASIGATLPAAADSSWQDIYVRADKALYAAKAAGRNNTVVMD